MPVHGPAWCGDNTPMEVLDPQQVAPPDDTLAVNLRVGRQRLMNPAELSVAVRDRARDLGFDLVGFGSAEPFAAERELILQHLASGYLEGMAWITPERVALSCDPEALLPGVRTVIGLGTAYAQPEAAPAPLPAGGTSPKGEGTGMVAGDLLRGRVARYAWGRDYHDVIPPKLKALAAFVCDLAGPQTRCRTFVDTGPLVDRAAAVRAGLGFVGKNTCVLTGPHGSYVFLSAVLTTAEIAPDPLVTKDCGSCRACIDACPTTAILGPNEIDATRCISYLTIEHRGSIPHELRPQMGDWVFGCDICQEVCPWNRARSPAAHPEYAPSEGAGSALDLGELLGLDAPKFRARFRGTPLTRAKRRGLLRNAAVALGNLGDPAAVPALLGALTDPEPLVREHAAWALRQLGPLPDPERQVLARALDRETDFAARAELEAALGSIARISGWRRAPRPPSVR